ncbi:MAG TPA: HAMP domain-containing sensor histidine kinase [Acidimicrobiales bacterium]|nr:HAMP domain-containing sensor histidine kinase [Acidimicrobiales bacterium]
MIRRRLTAAIVVLVAVIGGVVALVFLRTLESRLTAAVDRELDRVPAAVTRVTAARMERRAERDTGLFDIRRIAFVRLGPGGRVVASEPSGPTGDPDPLPDVAGLSAPAGPVTVGASGDGPRYRVVTSSVPGGGVFATAISLDDVDTALSNARRVLLVAGLVALGATAGATWFAIRRGLQPIDRMVATAEAIAAGNTDERIEVAHPESEVGRLGTALNRMLDRIGESLAARTASEQRMRRFVADASHELRTPLTAIRGYAELYRQGGDDAGDVGTSMDRIERAAARMGALVDDLVLLARLDQGRPLEGRPVDLAAVVEEAVSDARAVEPSRTVEVAGVGRALVTGDRARLRQVVDNLLANVREHTDPQTQVTVRLEATRRDVVLVVADDGPGMTEAEAARAFDRFWQAKATQAHPRRGTGLGLAIVTDLVAAHGGEIALDTAPGAGTRVTIRLPAADPPS